MTRRRTRRRRKEEEEDALTAKGILVESVI